MRPLDCEELRDIATEFAVDALDGDDRAAVIAHLDTCSSCQDIVSSLAAVADRLLLLAPPVEPALGFADRVMAALAPAEPEPVAERGLAPVAASRTRSGRGTVRAFVAAAAVVLAALVLAGGPSAPPALAEATMRAPTGEIVGHAFVHRDTPAVLVLSLPGWADEVARRGWDTSSYFVRVEREDGALATLPVSDNDVTAWAIPLSDQHPPVTSVAVIDGSGYVWCEATFAAT